MCWFYPGSVVDVVLMLSSPLLLVHSLAELKVVTVKMYI